VFLLALCLLAALVWWRVLHRDDSSHAAKQPTCQPSNSPKTLPQPGAVTVTVLNSTKRNGIAGAARTVLIKDGFRSPEKAQNDDKQFGGHGVLPGVAEIRYGPLGTDGARLLGYYFPGATLVKTQATDSTVFVALGTKYKAVNTPAKVAAALKADGITLVRTTGAQDDSPSPRC
jgi:hypothetical protein